MLLKLGEGRKARRTSKSRSRQPSRLRAQQSQLEMISLHSCVTAKQALETRVVYNSSSSQGPEDRNPLYTAALSHRTLALGSV